MIAGKEEIEVNDKKEKDIFYINPVIILMKTLRSTHPCLYYELGNYKRHVIHTHDLYHAIANDYMELIYKTQHPSSSIPATVYASIETKHQWIQSIIAHWKLEANVRSLFHLRSITKIYLNKSIFFTNIRYLNPFSKVEGTVDGIVHRNVLYSRLLSNKDQTISLSLLQKQYYMLVVHPDISKSDYHFYKQCANLMYMPPLCEHGQIEKQFFFSIHPTTFLIQCHRIEPTHETTIRSWIQRIRRHLNFASLYQDERTIGHGLYPNMKTSSQFQSQKRQFAEQVGELTMLWGVTDKHKQIAFQQCLFSWKNPSFVAERIGFEGRKKHILNRILEINRSPTDHPWMDVPCSFYQEDFLRWKTSQHVFIDFEYTSSHVYLIGMIIQNQYHALWSDELSDESELRLWKTFHQWISSLPEQSVLWYWCAEKGKYKSKCNQYNLPILREDSWKDMCQWMQKGPITMKHAFDYKLKSIIEALYRNQKITYHYEQLECQNGLESIQLANDYFQRKNPVVQSEIEVYNKMDCQGMYDLFQIIQKNA